MFANMGDNARLGGSRMCKYFGNYVVAGVYENEEVGVRRNGLLINNKFHSIDEIKTIKRKRTLSLNTNMFLVYWDNGKESLLCLEEDEAFDMNMLISKMRMIIKMKRKNKK